MLDDDNYLDRIDSQGALQIAAQQPDQLNYETEDKIELPKKEYQNVVYIGMGGSALAAGICKNWWSERLKVPFEIIREYRLPAYVDENTLVICASYSGNTEEVLEGFIQARECGTTVVVMASGGELARQATQDKLPLYELPTGYQPRMSVWYSVRLLAEIFEEAGLLTEAQAELKAAQSLLYTAAKEWGREVPTATNDAKQIAVELMGKPVWIYAGPILSSAAYKWKIDFNENAKNVASWNELPEFNHNEFVGWTSHPIEKPFGVVELMSHLDHPQIEKRFSATNRLLSGRMPAPILVEAKGQTQIEQLLWSCLLGDFVSIYVGILNGVNPTAVEAIEKLKRELRPLAADTDSDEHSA